MDAGTCYTLKTIENVVNRYGEGQNAVDALVCVLGVTAADAEEVLKARRNLLDHAEQLDKNSSEEWGL